MSLITAYFKKEATSVDALLPEISHNINVDTRQVKCPDSVHHSVDLLVDEDSNLKTPSPPKKMKIALFASHEKPTDMTSDYTGNHEAEQSNKLQDAVVTREEEMSVTEEMNAMTANVEDSGIVEQITAQLPKQQSRQTTLKFENGKCVLVPMELSTGMETGSQESSQVDSTTEDEYHPKKQQTKKKKKGKRKNSNEEVCSDNVGKEVEPSVAKKRSRKAAKEAAKQMSELLQEAVPPQSSSLSKLTSEDDHVKLPEILVVDSDNVEEIQTAFDCRSSSNGNKSNTNEEISIEPSPTVVEETIVDNSSDSDVICLTPRSASPLSQESAEQPQSRPSTPAKNKWSHIFGTKSPQKKSSPSRKSSPCKYSPRKSTPTKRITTTLSSLATSHEHYTLGVPLFHHVMQQDDSVLWSLPKVELPRINAHLTNLSRNQPHVHTTGAPQDQFLSKRLISFDSEVQRSPLNLKVRKK